MAFWPVPDLMVDSLYDLKPRYFRNRGICFLLLDVDNTLAPYTVNHADERLKKWCGEMRQAGIELFLLSNNRGERPSVFARELEIDFIGKAWKPFPKVAAEVLNRKNIPAEKAAVVGDQIYTDTLCAKLLGAAAVLVHPIAFTNFLLRPRYWLEWPFRLAYRRKQER